MVTAMVNGSVDFTSTIIFSLLMLIYEVFGSPLIVSAKNS